jgi:hypothetical protein
MHTNISSAQITGFSISGSLATLHLCNEAESSSQILRLTGLPSRASAWGLLLSLPSRLYAVYSINIFSTFQLTRNARFILAHLMDTDTNQ